MASRLAIDGGTPVRDRMLVFGAPVLGEEEIAEVVDTLRSGWIGTGPKTAAFESEFAAYVGAKHAIAVNSCTAALHLSLVVSGVGPEDEIVTSPLTFCATANVAVHQGAIPRFADIDPVTLNIAPGNIDRALTPRTKAILPVHFGGLPCDLDAIDALAAARGLTVVEDAAHAIGTRYQGRMVGGRGTLTCFSFYANKNLTTAEGGMVTCDNDERADLLAVYRLHGLNRDAWQRYQVKRLVTSDTIHAGYKYNLTDLQASIGIHQLRKQEAFLEARHRIAARFDAAFSSWPGVRLQPRPDDAGTRHGLHLYVLILDPACFRVGRDEIISALRAENIGAAIHYRALHTHPYYRDRFGYQRDDFPVAAEVGERILSLPLTPGMSGRDVEDVIEAVSRVLEARRA